MNTLKHTITAEELNKLSEYLEKYNNYEKRITKAYDLIERLEYRVVELENKIRDLEKSHSY